MSWVIPTVMAYGAAGYLALLWYSDYLKRQENTAKRKITSLASAYISDDNTKGTAKQKVDAYLNRCSLLLDRVINETSNPRLVEAESSFESKTPLLVTRPVKRSVIKKTHEKVTVEERSDYENILGVKYNTRKSTGVNMSTSFEYSHSYLDGLLKIKKPIDLTSRCWSLVENTDSDMPVLEECLYKAAEY